MIDQLLCLDELFLAIFDQFDIDLGASAVWYYLQRNSWSGKVVKEKAAQRISELRALRRSKAAYWTKDQLVFVDESPSNEKTGWRKSGWSPQGQSCSVLQLL